MSLCCPQHKCYAATTVHVCEDHWRALDTLSHFFFLILGPPGPVGLPGLPGTPGASLPSDIRGRPGDAGHPGTDGSSGMKRGLLRVGLAKGISVSLRASFEELWGEMTWMSTVALITWDLDQGLRMIRSVFNSCYWILIWFSLLLKFSSPYSFHLLWYWRQTWALR